MAVKFILTLVLLQLVSAAPGPDPEPDPNVYVNVDQNVDVSCGCSKCPCEKDGPSPTSKCDYTICNGTLCSSTVPMTGVCAPCEGYKGWINMGRHGHVDKGCPAPPPWPACMCYVNGCSNCSCSVYMGNPPWGILVPGICADPIDSNPILRGWRDNGADHGCHGLDKYGDDLCHCYTPPRMP